MFLRHTQYLDEVLVASDFFRVNHNIPFAINFAKRAKSWAEKSANPDFIARANGYLGVLYASENKEIEKAYKYLQNSITFFHGNEIGSPEIYPIEQTIIELLEKNKKLKPSLTLPPTAIYAGIEVGSKGVKLSVTRLSYDIDGNYDYEVVKDSSINTSIISFIPSAVEETAEAVKIFVDYATTIYRISDDKIYTAISSGVQQRAEKKGKLLILSELQEAIRVKLNSPNRQIAVITPRDESQLTHIGVIKKADRERAMIVDIGSGNTKGGFFDKGLVNFNNFSFNYGTQALANEVNESLTQPTLNTYLTALNSKISQIKNELIRPTLNAKSTLRDKPLIVQGLFIKK